MLMIPSNSDKSLRILQNKIKNTFIFDSDHISFGTCSKGIDSHCALIA